LTVFDFNIIIYTVLGCWMASLSPFRLRSGELKPGTLEPDPDNAGGGKCLMSFNVIKQTPSRIFPEAFFFAFLRRKT
jgi:hypothetical protein